jgi:hypothetical protein
MDEEQLKEYQERMKARWAQDAKSEEDKAESVGSVGNIGTSAAASGNRDIALYHFIEMPLCIVDTSSQLAEDL